MNGKKNCRKRQQQAQGNDDCAAEDLDHLCKAMPGNTAYCGFSNAKSTTDETQDTLGFTTPEYAKRFAKALRHAVTLCGGNKSTF